jgi:hypothetical protein
MCHCIFFTIQFRGQRILTSAPRSYVPENLNTDSFTHKVVKADIQEELTQTRAKLKKTVCDILSISTIMLIESTPQDTGQSCRRNTKGVANYLRPRISNHRQLKVNSNSLSLWTNCPAGMLYPFAFQISVDIIYSLYAIMNSDSARCMLSRLIASTGTRLTSDSYLSVILQMETPKKLLGNHFFCTYLDLLIYYLS